jgi:hypothetical protein
MRSQRSIFLLRLAIALGATAIPLKAHSQETSLVLSDKTIDFSFNKVDGPYSYKSPRDVTPIVGFVTAVSGQQATFLTCGGGTITVQLNALTHIRRNCPPGSPVGTWAVSNGKIIYQRNPNIQIPAESLPGEWQATVRKAKQGEFVGVSQPNSNGHIDLSLINESGRS